MKTKIWKTLSGSPAAVRITQSRKLAKKARTLKKKCRQVYPEIKGPALKARIDDIQKCCAEYGMIADEYFEFHFESVPEKERSGFITARKRIEYYTRLNRTENEMIFSNKYLTYQSFRPFYKRDVAYFTRDDQAAEFDAFLSKHRRIILKPINGSKGIGVQIVEQGDYLSLLRSYRKAFLAEEIICQNAEMAKLNPDSVNTVRFTTVRMDDRIEFFMPILRCGRPGMCIDNGSAGGVFCGLDFRTGKVTGATMKSCKELTCHPDSGMELIGFQIPRWEEAIKLVEELCAVVPSNRYTGWDLALAEDGWLMIEGNCCGEFAMQMIDHKGMKPKMDALLRELGLSVPTA